MQKHILVFVILASFFVADYGEAQILRRLFGLQAPNQQQFQQPFAPGFNTAQPRNLFQPEPGPTRQEFFDRPEFLNRPELFDQRQAYPPQQVTGQRPVPVRPQGFSQGQMRFMERLQQQQLQVQQQLRQRRIDPRILAQQNVVREALVTVQTPNGPRLMRVQMPNVNAQLQTARTAPMPPQQAQQLQYQQPNVQTNQLAAQPPVRQQQPAIQQPLSVPPAQPDVATVVPPAIGTTQNVPVTNPVVESASINGFVEPLDQPIQTQPALAGPALSAPTSIAPVADDISEVVPASATFEESVAPISADEAAPDAIPELNAPSDITETKTQGAPSILKKK